MWILKNLLIVGVVYSAIGVASEVKRYLNLNSNLRITSPQLNLVKVVSYVGDVETIL